MAFLHNLTLAVCIFSTLTNAIPYHGSPVVSSRSNSGRLAKRTNPIIGEGIDINDPARGGKLVSRPNFPTSGSGIDSDSPIFRHYFNEEDRSKVKAVFAKLAGNSETPEDVDNEGAKELGQITFQGVNTPNNGDDSGCDKPGTNMYTEYYDTDGPVVVVCEDAWYVGNQLNIRAVAYINERIIRVFPDRDDQNCDEMGDTLNPDMAILGHLVLHEFTHWDWFLTGITKGEVVDEHGPDKISGYGLENVYYDLDKKYAPFNADSSFVLNGFADLEGDNRYAWYATEVMWSIICAKTYKEPRDDGSD
ncbi:MAG: hypothetical protein Q9164_001941 [Protoblastenia rupestris]